MVKATAAWVTLTVELIFAIWLLVLKIKIDGFEGCGSKSSVKAVARDDKEDMSGHTELEAMEMGSVGFNEGQLAICVDGNIDLTRKIDSLKYKDAIRFRHNSTIGPETLVKDAYRGFHIMIDVVFTIDLDPEFGKDLLAHMCELAKMHKVRVVHDHIEIFDGEVSPPGFAAVALLDESHMSAHCYSDQGKLAFDVFTAAPNRTAHEKWHGMCCFIFASTWAARPSTKSTGCHDFRFTQTRNPPAVAAALAKQLSCVRKWTTC